jgi:hypothetical protein
LEPFYAQHPKTQFWFQSLIGILVYWNTLGWDNCSGFKFQSLIGILVYWNICVSVKSFVVSVSIPNRDFSLLEHKALQERRALTDVSIPNRDFSLLELEPLHPSCVLKQGFQSLIGILVYWNRPQSKALMYLVFKVQLRQPRIRIAFQTLGCQE